MTGQFVYGGNYRLYARVSKYGGDSPWLVFSNSLMTDHSIWDAQVAQFNGRYNILTYDQRGHGRSDVAAEVTFDALSDDVVVLLDHFEIEACTYIGLSMGVPTGLNLARRHPKRVSHMVLSDGQMATQPNGHQTWQARIDAARANGMPWVAKDTVERWFSPKFIAAGGADRLHAAAAAMPVEGYCACARALQDYDFTLVAKALAIPVQLVAGGNDGAMPQTMKSMAETIPQAQFDIIADAGHIPNVEQPARFNAIVDSFLESHKA